MLGTLDAKDHAFKIEASMFRQIKSEFPKRFYQDKIKG